MQSSLHLDNCCGAVSGAPPAPVWSMHIASPLLLIPRTEPPLIQAQRGL
nr:fluoroacetate dehalogenase [Micrococcus sp. A1]